MSHKATTWALDQRGLKPLARLILIEIADCHNGQSGRCFPSQTYIAEACNISLRSVVTHMEELERVGLISRDSRFDPKTNRRKPTEYTLHLEKSHVQNLHSDTKATCNPRQKPRANGSKSHVQNLHNNLGIDNPEVNPEDTQSEFEGVWNSYPRKVGKGAAEKAWEKARKSAAFPEIVLPLALYVRAVKGTDPQFIPHLATWLNQRRWEDEPDHASNRPRTSTDDLDALSRIPGDSAADLDNLFSPQLRIVKQ